MRGTSATEVSRSAARRKMKASEELPKANIVEMAVNIQKRTLSAAAGMGCTAALDVAGWAAAVATSAACCAGAGLRSRRKMNAMTIAMAPGTMVHAKTARRSLLVITRMT